MRYIHEKNNYIVFTLVLFLLLLASAVVNSVPALRDSKLVDWIILLTQAAAYSSLDFGRRWRYFVVAIVVGIVAMNIVNEAVNWPWASLSALVLILVFYLTVTVNLARRVLFPKHVDINIVFGALAIYLLLGLIWASLYLLTLEAFPHAFQGMERHYWSYNFSDALYYSYITMTTVGYGDILPVMTLSRTLAYLQATIGTFYMAVVVASLIGARKHAPD